MVGRSLLSFYELEQRYSFPIAWKSSENLSSCKYNEKWFYDRWTTKSIESSSCSSALLKIGSLKCFDIVFSFIVLFVYYVGIKSRMPSFGIAFPKKFATRFPFTNKKGINGTF